MGGEDQPGLEYWDHLGGLATTTVYMFYFHLKNLKKKLAFGEALNSGAGDGLYSREIEHQGERPLKDTTCAPAIWQC